MTKTDQDYIHYKDDDKELEVTMENGTDVTNANEMVWEMKEYSDSDSALIAKDTSDGVDLSYGDTDQFKVTIDSDDVSDITADNEYYHEAVMTDTNDKISTVMTGTVDLRP